MKIEKRKKQSTLTQFLNGCEKHISALFYLTALILNRVTTPRGF